MPTINQLSSTSSLASGDQIPVYDASDGDARKASLSTLLSFIEANFANPDLETQTFAPTGSGFTVTATASTSSIWMIVNPTGAFAAGTVQFPPDEDCFDGQVIVVTSSQAVTALTVDGNGATVAGAPSALGTNGFAQFRYQASATKWWCVAQSLGSIDSFTDITITGSILSGDGETMLAFAQAGVGAAVNHLTVAYSVAGTGVGLIPAGSDANIDLELVQKGSGDIRIGNSSATDATMVAGADATLRAIAGTARVEADAGAAVLIGGNTAISSSSTDITVSAATDLLLIATSDLSLTAGGVIDVQDRMVFATAPVLSVSTVAALPASPVIGLLAVVTDATATTHHSIVAGGGANSVVVFYDGTNWRIA